MEVKIEKLDDFGRGITYVNNKITFVKNALENEIVEIDIIKENKKYNEAVVKNIISKSDTRVIPKCPYYDVCGGCNLMHMKYEQELKLKEQKIKNLIKKYTSIDDKVVKKIIPTKEYYYRNKATFQVREKIGYYKEKSYEIIEIDKCLLVDKKINEILKKIKKLNLQHIDQIVIRVSNNSEMVIFKCNYDIDENIKNLEVENVVIYNKQYKVIKGSGFIIENIGNFKYKISPDSFFQVNTKGAEILYDKVKEYASSSKKILDLYCGTGSIGIFLSDISDYIKGIEMNKYAIDDAKQNAKMNNLKNIDFLCSAAAGAKNQDYDTIIVDPPRDGLDKEVIKFLNNSSAKKIIYVSCDPVTLVRDLNLLDIKYNVIEITPVNMFSKTYHCESVSILERR